MNASNPQSPTQQPNPLPSERTCLVCQGTGYSKSFVGTADEPCPHCLPPLVSSPPTAPVSEPAGSELPSGPGIVWMRAESGHRIILHPAFPGTYSGFCGNDPCSGFVCELPRGRWYAGNWQPIAHAELAATREKLAGVERERDEARKHIAAAWSRLTGWDAVRIANGSHAASADPAAALLEACATIVRERDAAREEIANFKERLQAVKIATCQGAMAAALGKPLHTVSQSGYAARSLNGDAWEQGWQYVAESAEGQRLAGQLTAATQRAETAERAWIDKAEEVSSRLIKEAYDIIYAGEPEAEREIRWKWVIIGLRQMKARVAELEGQVGRLREALEKVEQLRPAMFHEGNRGDDWRPAMVDLFDAVDRALATPAAAPSGFCSAHRHGEDPTCAVCYPAAPLEARLATMQKALEAERSIWQTVISPMHLAPRDGTVITAVWIEAEHPKIKVVRWSTGYSIHGLGGCWTEGVGQYGDMHFAGWFALSRSAPIPTYTPPQDAAGGGAGE